MARCRALRVVAWLGVRHAIGIDSDQSVYQVRLDDSIDERAPICAVTDAIEHQFIVSLLDDFGDALHNVWHQGPGERRCQRTQQARFAPGETRRRDARYTAMLIHHPQHPLTGLWVYIGLMIEHTRNSCC